MIVAGQWHVECLVLQAWDADTLDPAHLTGMHGIVAFHVHKHGNSGNVTKASNNIGREGEEAAREGIICRYSNCKLKKFLYKQMDEGVCIPWLFWTGYDPSTKDVVLLEALVWREVAVEDEEDPCGMLPLFEWSKAIGGEAECNIMVIREVVVG